MRIATNIAALKSIRHVGDASLATSKTSEQLSSGDRIFRSAYDPTGLAISEKMKSVLRSMQQSQRNANDAISMTQVAEGALVTIGDLSNRLQELAIRSANGTFTDIDRKNINIEYVSLRDEILKISKSTEFNGSKVFDDRLYEYQVGTRNTECDKLLYEAHNLMKKVKASEILNTDVLTLDNARASLRPVQMLVQGISSARADIGGIQSRMNAAIENLLESNLNLEASKSRIRDMDVAQGTADQAKNHIMSQASSLMLKTVTNAPSKVAKLIE